MKFPPPPYASHRVWVIWVRLSTGNPERYTTIAAVSGSVELPFEIIGGPKPRSRPPHGTRDNLTPQIIHNCTFRPTTNVPTGNHYTITSKPQLSNTIYLALDKPLLFLENNFSWIQIGIYKIQSFCTYRLLTLNNL